MNISFLNKAAIGLIILTLCLIGVWRYEFGTENPRHKALITALQTDLRERDQLSGSIAKIVKVKASIERVAAQGRVDANVAESVAGSLNELSAEGNRIFSKDNPFNQLSADVNEFFKISGQLALYEGKVAEFISSFKAYFQVFDQTVNRWQEDTSAAITSGAVVFNTIPFVELKGKVSALENIIPEVVSFKNKLQSIESGFDQWAADINNAVTVEEKQAAFDNKKSLLRSVPELFSTFSGYVELSVGRERANAQQIAQQIAASLTDIQTRVQDKFAVKNNSIQTVMAQTKYKDEQYRKIKIVAVSVIFVGIIGLFFAMTLYSFRFERGLAIFRRKTFEAAQASREVSSSLKDNSTLAIQNFDLARTLQEGLQEVSGGFLARQKNLQHVDLLVRDTDALIKESQENFVHIKDEFYNADRLSAEIINLTSALEGVAQQMTSVAERVTANPHEMADKEKTIDELKYLAGRIRYTVNATHSTLDGRSAKIEEAKAKFALIESNMAQMTENTKQALRTLALTRLDHSEEIGRINEILENARNSSRAIAKEIEVLNKQISDFSVLSGHLAALHELAVKASALNAQSLLPAEEAATAQVASSERMNTYVQEYFKKIFENTSLKPIETTSEVSVENVPAATNRIKDSAEV